MTDSAAPASTAGSGKSPKAGLLGCGCGAVVVALMVLLLAFTFFAWRQSRQLQSGYDSPELAAAQVREVLPHDELPEGYHPLGAASVPVFFRLAILTDLPPEARGRRDARKLDSGKRDSGEGESGEGGSGEAPRRFHRSGFIYFSTFSLRSDDAELLRYFREGPAEGEEEMDLNLPDDSVAGDLGVDFAAREVLARGAEPVHEGRVYYVARRGRLEVSGDGFQGLATLFYLKCEEGRRVRFGLWFAPEPSGLESGESGELAGTPADPQALTDFLGHFWICG